MVSYSIFISPLQFTFFSIDYHSSTTTAGFSIFWHAPAFAIFAYFPKMVYLIKEKLFNFIGILIKEAYEENPKIRYPAIEIEEIDNSENLQCLS